MSYQGKNFVCFGQHPMKAWFLAVLLEYRWKGSKNSPRVDENTFAVILFEDESLSLYGINHPADVYRIKCEKSQTGSTQHYLEHVDRPGEKYITINEPVEWSSITSPGMRAISIRYSRGEVGHPLTTENPNEIKTLPENLMAHILYPTPKKEQDQPETTPLEPTVNPDLFKRLMLCR